VKRAQYRNPTGTALLLIDVINDLDFPQADELLQSALPMAKKIQQLKTSAQQAGAPVIYVNDNFGRWQSDWKSQVAHCERPESNGREIVQLLRPDSDDFFVLKPKHSGFYSTTLDVLLQHLSCRSVILTGIATNICVLFTANDAYMRDYRVRVPRDCSAANRQTDHDDAIRQMEWVLKAETCPGEEIQW